MDKKNYLPNVPIFNIMGMRLKLVIWAMYGTYPPGPFSNYYILRLFSPYSNVDMLDVLIILFS